MIENKYIDKIDATIAVLKDYKNMRDIIEVTSQEIKNIYEDMTNTHGHRLSDSPRSAEVNIGEQAIDYSLDILDIIRNRYNYAMEYMRWFNPAWKLLNEEEQLILKSLIINKSDTKNEVEKLSKELYISRAQVYRRKNKAIKHLSILLFGLE